MNIKSCTDKELLQQILPDIDEPSPALEEAWQEFFIRSNEFLIKVFRKLCRTSNYYYIFTEEDFYDLTQQVYSKLLEDNYNRLRELKFLSKGSIKPYLVAAATNLVKDHLRAYYASRRIPPTQSLNELLLNEEKRTLIDLIYSQDMNPEEEFLEKELLQQVLSAIQQESENGAGARNQDIFLMAYLDGYTRNEIAEHQEYKLKKAGINSYLKGILPKIKRRLIRSYYIKASILLLMVGSLFLGK